MSATSVMPVLPRIAARSVTARRSLALFFVSLALGFVSLLLPMKAGAVTTSSVQLNSANWSDNAGYGSSVPSWYEAQGLIHLQGAAKQISTSNANGANPWLIGTLPPQASPDRWVYTVVHTFAGTYSTLAIYPDGEIFVLGGDPPAGPDYTFVSLEGVTYRPYSGGAQAITVNSPDWTTGYVAGDVGPAGAFPYYGNVELQGDANLATTSGATPNPNLVGTLPQADWPDRTVYTIVHAYGAPATGPNCCLDGYADLAINSQGQVFVIYPRPQVFALPDIFLPLEGVSYEQSSAGAQAIAVNGANWTSNAGYGSGAPRWAIDQSGVVHLEGAAKQISTSNANGANPWLIGTLPPQASPTRWVYTVVHTFAGTYADLAIDPQGQIFAIDPKAPAIKDYTFVSLEGITYQR